MQAGRVARAGRVAKLRVPDESWIDLAKRLERLRNLVIHVSTRDFGGRRQSAMQLAPACARVGERNQGKVDAILLCKRQLDRYKVKHLREAFA